MAPVASMFPTILLLVAISTASARFIAPEMLGEVQREMYDPYDEAREQELDAPAAEVQQRPGTCKNYHGTLIGNIPIAGSVCAASSRNGCARVTVGRRGLIRSFKLCHPNGGRTLCYKSGSICGGNEHRWKSTPIRVPVPGRSPVLVFADIVGNDLCFAIPAYQC